MKLEEEKSFLDPSRDICLQTLRVIYTYEVTRGIKDPLVREAFAKVDRLTFVPKGYEEWAYTDRIIPLEEEGASISQPSLVALMTECLHLTGTGKVLEIGTGSGFGAAILSSCASEVHTIEINEKLAGEAQERLRNFGYGNINVYVGDGALGLPEKAPFDAIIVTAGSRNIPRVLLEQLREGGWIVIPAGTEPVRQKLVAGVKYFGELYARIVADVRFHPLISSADGGWGKKEIDRILRVRMEYVRQMAEKRGLSEEKMYRHLAEKIGVSPKKRGIILDYLPLPDDVLEDITKEYESFMRGRDKNLQAASELERELEQQPRTSDEP